MSTSSSNSQTKISVRVTTLNSIYISIQYHRPLVQLNRNVDNNRSTKATPMRRGNCHGFLLISFYLASYSILCNKQPLWKCQICEILGYETYKCYSQFELSKIFCLQILSIYQRANTIHCIACGEIRNGLGPELVYCSSRHVVRAGAFLYRNKPVK